LGSHSSETINALSDSFGEPQWLREFRLESLSYFENLPLEISPLYKKYAYLSNFDPSQFGARPPTESPDLRSFFSGYLTGKETNIALQGNSSTIHVDLDAGLASKGVEMMSIREAIATREPLMKEIFARKLVGSDSDKYAAFTNAFFNSGTYVFIPRGVEVGAPLRKLILVRNPQTSIIDRSIIYAEEHSKVNLLEELYSAESSGQYLLSSVLEVHSGPSAHVDVSSIELLDERALYLSNRNASIVADAKATMTGIYLGASVVRSRLNFLLNGRGSLAEGFEVFFSDGRQRFDFETNLVHNSPDSSAATQARGVLKNQSQSIFKGMIKIAEHSKNSNSYLAHHAMLMDKDARSHGIPGLSIDTNEVKATHSASVAQIDEEQIFYLMSRGLDQDEAKKMIILGFFEPVLSRIPVEIAREGAKFMLEGKWYGEKRRLVDHETLLALTGEIPKEVRESADIFERHYKYRK
jgi:Fe-S cluster assembly protein SufB/Fe-S cluster assembly protein SufD